MNKEPFFPWCVPERNIQWSVQSKIKPQNIRLGVPE